MGLRDIEHTLPPGFRFYPSDEELVCYYLYKKIAHEEVDVTTTLVEVDLHTCEPWQLPEAAKLNSKEWYFFTFRNRKYATGFRTNRATVSGYWKATGKDRAVVNPTSRAIVGMRKTLVFYKNRAPNGIKSGWIMHEFRLVENPNSPPKEDWVLCRVFHKTMGPSTSSWSAAGGSDVNKWSNCAHNENYVSKTNLSAGDHQQYHHHHHDVHNDKASNCSCSCCTCASSSSSSSSIALSGQLVDIVDPMDLLHYHHDDEEYGFLLDDNDMMMMMSFECSINGDE